MRDFFQRQDNARKVTRRLIAFFALAVLFIVCCVYLAVRSVYILMQLNEPVSALPPLWDPGVFGSVALATTAIILGGSIYKIKALQGGGRRVAEMLGGRLVAPETRNPDERRLLNVVEEMAIASGVPVPDVYVMDRERSINAFAAGFSHTDAVVCVTEGALRLLDRDELQGVVAHEISHILNSDTRVNIHLMGWLHGILLIGLLGEGIVRGLGRTRTRSGGAAIVLGFALYIVGGLGVFLGKLIKSGVSRQREYLADASAVQFTRNPSGLADALKKVGGLVGSGRIAHPRVSEASHMYFCNGLRESWLSSLATHPPLLERIQILDPSFDGVFPDVEALPVPNPVPDRPPRRPLKASVEPVQMLSGAAVAAILETVGAPMRQHAELARQLIDELPEAVRLAVHQPVSGCALVYLLLLDRVREVRDRQVEILKHCENPPVVAEVEALYGYLPQLPPRLRLPLLDLILPALRRLSDKQYGRFRACVEQLVAADDHVSLFEFTLKHILMRHLEGHFGTPRRKLTQIYGLRGVDYECSAVLSLLARVGHADEEQAEAAFGSGRRILSEPKVVLEYLPAEECSLKGLEKALDALAVASPPIKRKLLAACLESLIHDQVITVEEVELFRAVADALGCPVPPWLAAGFGD